MARRTASSRPLGCPGDGSRRQACILHRKSPLTCMIQQNTVAAYNTPVRYDIILATLGEGGGAMVSSGWTFSVAFRTDCPHQPLSHHVTSCASDQALLKTLTGQSSKTV